LKPDQPGNQTRLDPGLAGTHHTGCTAVKFFTTKAAILEFFKLKKIIR
jgi:hypothetical protein